MSFPPRRILLHLGFFGSLAFSLVGVTSQAATPSAESADQTATVARPGWLGLGLNYRESEDAENPTGWFFVRLVHAGGPGAKAGVKTHDLITEIDGHPFRFANGMEVLDFFADLDAGQEIELKVRRAASEKTLRVIAVAMPDEVYEKWQLLYQEVKRRHEAGLGHL